MYIKSDATEKELIEQAIREAEHARNEYITTKVLNGFGRLKSWLVANLDARKSKGDATPSSNAQVML